jgi:plastocyanin
MFNTVAKIQLGLAAFVLCLSVYVFNVHSDPGGFVLLFGVCVAVVLSALALAGSGFNDRAPRFASLEDAPPVQMVTVGQTQAARPSPWPLVGGAAVGVAGLGLAIGRGIVEIGVVVALVAAAGWLAQLWREDPSFTPAEGAKISSRLLVPFALPLMALGLIGVVIVSVSRILLTLPRTGSIIAAFILALGLLLTFYALASRPHLGRNSLVFLSVFSVVVLVTAGSVSAANGYRTFEVKPGSGPIKVVARNTAFDVKTISVTQGQLSDITFDNLDRGVYHNVAVYGSNGTPYWDGQPVEGKKKINYAHVFNLPPGTYTFRCDFHPTIMTGTFIVKAASASSTAQGTP